MNQIAVDKMLASGISPLELVCYPVLSCRDNTEKGRFTELHINSLDLGTLTPAQYRVVTNRNALCLRLCTWAFRRAVSLLQDDRGWISFYVPAKALLNGHLEKLLESEAKQENASLSHLVAEVSSEILYADAEQVAERMTALRRTFGIRFLLSEFGDEFSPIQRLSLYPVDFVLLDSCVNSGETLAAASAAVKLAKQNRKTVIARMQRPTDVSARDALPDCYIPGQPASERRGS